MASKPPKHNVVPDPRVVALTSMQKAQEKATSARITTPLAPTENLSMKRMEMVARGTAAAATRHLVDQVKSELSDAVKRAGIAHSTARRVAVPKLDGGKTRRATRSGGDIVTHLLTIRNQIKLYHWQTKQFARHKATDDLTAALDLNIDAFVESYMGRYGRPTVSGSIKLHNFSESAAKAFVARESKYLETVLPRKIGKTDTDLLNLRDTILGDLTKASYLFTLQ